jgi:hypothetical protein
MLKFAKILKEKILVLSSIIISLLFIELFLRILSVNLPVSDLKSPLYKEYSKEELDLSLPFRHKNHGGECIKINSRKKMRWHPRFGRNDKNIDFDCVEQLFSEGKNNIIFMGGSAMASYETPNFLTSIEYYMFKNTDAFRSINLAEGGARLSNELSIFIEYVPKMKIKPDIIIFFNGYNEFNGIRYNGEPDDDYYWAAGVKRRVHEPYKFYFDVVIERSHLFKFLFHGIFGFSSVRIPPEQIAKSKIIEAAKDYVYRKNILNNLCDDYKIKCIYVLQPAFVLSKNLTGKTDQQINKWILKYYKFDEMITKLGYNEILNLSRQTKSLTNIFDNQSNIYFDYVHTNKYGSEIIGKELRKILNFEKN